LSFFDWFWRGTGGDTASVYPMNKEGIKAIEKEFNMKMLHENKTDVPDEYKDILPVSKKNINKEMSDLIRQVDSIYYGMYEKITIDLSNKKPQ